jgi:hypothetical protein
MKFIIPQKDDLTLEVIKEEFLKKYYPEMTVRQGWWKIFGRYVMLQKNPFVCAAFYVKQKSKQQKTQIRIMKDSNIWANIIGAPVIQKFISGDFYVDIEYNFEKFLKKKYGLRDEEIVKEKWNRNFWILAGVNLGVILLIMAIIYGIQSWKWANVWPTDSSEIGFQWELTNDAAKDLGYDVVEANYEYKGRDLFGYRLIYGPEKKVLLEKEYIRATCATDDYVEVNYTEPGDSGDYCNVYKSGKPIFKDKQFTDLTFIDNEILRYKKTNGSYGHCNLQGEEVSNLKTFMDVSDDTIYRLGFIVYVILPVVVNVIVVKKIRKKHKMVSLPLTVSEDQDETIIE